MSELEDLVGIYGAIDRAVQRQPELRPTVARFFGPYNDPNAVGWFGQFDAWTVERFGASRIPDLNNSVADLSRTPTSGRMAARRLLAIAVAARLEGALIAPDSPTNLADALAVDGLAGADRVESARGLLTLLVDDSVFANVGDWSQLIQTAVSQKLISESLAVQAAAAPCDCELVVVPQPGSVFPAAELHTSFTTTAITIEQAKRFLDPSVWPQCGHWWCEMRYISSTPRNTKIYHEIFSLDCAFPNAAWTVESYLEFAQLNVGAGARVSYRLSPDYSNPLVSVDEGWFTVQPAPHGAPGVQVDTVKRIRFNYPFGGQSLAMVICALGYGDAAEQLVLDCAVQNAANPGAGVPFQGTAPPSGPISTPTTTPPSSPPPNGQSIDSVWSDAIEQLKNCIDDCATAYKNGYSKMSSPDYSLDDAVALTVDMWSRYVREVAALAALALRSANAASATRTHDDGQPPGTG